MNNPPEITQAMRDEAKRQPGGYVYCIDSQYADGGVNGRIQPQAIIGAYPVNESGEIIPEFMPNPRYDESLER